MTTVRSDSKGRQCLEEHPQFTGKLSYTVVEDIARPGAFDLAVQAEPPFEAVLHTASPFHYHPEDLKRDMIDPAVRGTTEILRAVKSFAPSVRRVVVTSSFASVIKFKGDVAVYTSDMWNPITMEEALSSGSSAYVGSKKFAEEAAWAFVATEKPAFSLSTINPVLVFGPVLGHLESLDKINTSNVVFRDIVQGRMKGDIAPGSFQWVDVRDVALAHVRAIEVPEAAGKRFLASAGPYSNAQLGRIVQDNFPQLADKLPEEIKVADGPASFRIDTTPLHEILGISFRPLEETVVDTVKSLLKVGA